MRIRTTAAGIAAAIVLLAGCSDDGATGTPTTAPPTSASNGGGGDTTANGAPKVKTPLEYKNFEANPCSVVTAAQLEAFGMPGITGEANPGVPGKACIWLGSSTPGKATPGVAFVSNGGGLDGLYAKKGTFQLWEEQPPIQGYPAVLAQAADLRTRGDCALDVGVTDSQSITITIDSDKGGTRYADPCGAATEFANLVITTIKAGAK